MAQAEVDARDEPDSPDEGERQRASAREAQLEQLTFECLERIENEGPAVLEELCRAQPALAAELLERIHVLVQRGLVEVDAGALIALERADQKPPPLAAAPPRPGDGAPPCAPRPS